MNTINLFQHKQKKEKRHRHHPVTYLILPLRCFYCPKAAADIDFISSWDLGFQSLQGNMWVQKKKKDRNKWVRSSCLLFKLCGCYVLKWYWEVVETSERNIHFLARVVCFTSLDTCLSGAIQNNFICKRYRLFLGRWGDTRKGSTREICLIRMFQ